MSRYILKRCLSMIFILIGAAFVIFTITYFTPGDPADAYLTATATKEEVDYWHETHGLNDSYLVQFIWISAVLGHIMSPFFRN